MIIDLLQKATYNATLNLLSVEKTLEETLVHTVLLMYQHALVLELWTCEL